MAGYQKIKNTLWSIYKYQFFIYYFLVDVRSSEKRTGFEWFVELMHPRQGQPKFAPSAATNTSSEGNRGDQANCFHEGTPSTG